MVKTIFFSLPVPKIKIIKKNILKYLFTLLFQTINLRIFTDSFFSLILFTDLNNSIHLYSFFLKISFFPFLFNITWTIF